MFSAIASNVKWPEDIVSPMVTDLKQILELIRDDIPPPAASTVVQAHITSRAEVKEEAEDLEPREPIFFASTKKFGGGPSQVLRRSVPKVSKPKPKPHQQQEPKKFGEGPWRTFPKVSKPKPVQQEPKAGIKDSDASEEIFGIENLRKKFGGGPQRIFPKVSKPKPDQQEVAKAGIEDLAIPDEGSGVATLRKKFGRGGPPPVPSGVLPMICKSRSPEIEDMELPVDSVSDWSGIWPMVLKRPRVWESRPDEGKETQTAPEDLKLRAKNIVDLSVEFDSSGSVRVPHGNLLGVEVLELPSDNVAGLRKKFADCSPMVFKARVSEGDETRTGMEDLELPSDYVADLRKKFNGTNMPRQWEETKASTNDLDLPLDYLADLRRKFDGACPPHRDEEARASMEDLELPLDHFADLKKKFDGNSTPHQEPGTKPGAKDLEMPADKVADLREKFGGRLLPVLDVASPIVLKSRPFHQDVPSVAIAVADLRKKFDGRRPLPISSGSSPRPRANTGDLQLPPDNVSDLRKRFVGSCPLSLPVWPLPVPSGALPMVAKSKPHLPEEESQEGMVDLEPPSDSVANLRRRFASADMSSGRIVQSRPHQGDDSNAITNDLTLPSAYVADLRRKFDCGSATSSHAERPKTGMENLGLQPENVADLIRDVPGSAEAWYRKQHKTAIEDSELPFDNVADLRKRFASGSALGGGSSTALSSSPRRREGHKSSVEDLELPVDYLADLRKKFDSTRTPHQQEGTKAGMEAPELPSDNYPDLTKKFDGELAQRVPGGHSPTVVKSRSTQAKEYCGDLMLADTGPLILEPRACQAEEPKELEPPAADIANVGDMCDSDCTLSAPGVTSPMVLTLGAHQGEECKPGMEYLELPSDNFPDLRKKFDGEPPQRVLGGHSPMVVKSRSTQVKEYCGDMMLADSGPLILEPRACQAEEPEELEPPAADIANLGDMCDSGGTLSEPGVTSPMVLTLGAHQGEECKPGMELELLPETVGGDVLPLPVGPSALASTARPHHVEKAEAGTEELSLPANIVADGSTTFDGSDLLRMPRGASPIILEEGTHQQEEPKAALEDPALPSDAIADARREFDINDALPQRKCASTTVVESRPQGSEPEAATDEEREEGRRGQYGADKEGKGGEGEGEFRERTDKEWSEGTNAGKGGKKGRRARRGEKGRR